MAPVRWRMGPLKMLLGVIHMVLKDLLAEVPLVLPTKELSVLLGVLLSQLIEPLVEVGELICEKLIERELLGSRGAAIALATHRARCLLVAQWSSRTLRRLRGSHLMRGIIITLHIKIIIIARLACSMMLVSLGPGKGNRARP